MRFMTSALVLLLLGSNLAWWLGTSAAVGTAPPITQPAVDVAPSPAQDMERTRLQQELERAKARIGELERAPVRTPTPVTASPPNPGLAAARALAERQQRTEALAQQWTEAALQTRDPAQRTAALASIRDALLRNASPEEVTAALRSLARLRELDYDKASYRELVLPQLRADDAAVRAAALYALFNTAPQPADVPQLLAMVRDPSPEVRARLAHAIVLFEQGELGSESAGAVMQLLTDADPQVRRGVLSSLSGASVDERISTYYLDLARDAGQRHDAIYFGLSTFTNKSPAIVAALVEAMNDQDPEIAERAAWGLGHGVPAEADGVVADAFLGRLETRFGSQAIDEALLMLQRHGSARHVPALEAYAARPALAGNLRQRVEALVTILRQR